ncbi:unnamed protein product [Rotaria sp. Silwood1]|nr:unnamed protein product [Rotaria sp. Silwood1]CAF4938911.1 unnamed protein product [Rotaria sp. Silwood1]
MGWGSHDDCCLTRLEHDMMMKIGDDDNSSDVTDVQVQTDDASFQLSVQSSTRRFNFDDPRGLTDDEYCLLFSLSKDDFNELIQIISTSGIRNSSNRSIKTAIGIYLCKPRLGLSNHLLVCMFQLSDKRTNSKTIDSARQAVLNNFVPYNLGFGHVTCQDVIDHHATTISGELMCDGGGSNTAIVVIDDTYIYIQSDIVVVDRGFRDSISVMQVIGLGVAMPSFLDSKNQFSAKEANQSGCITKVRWVVETANRRIKQFKYFANTIQNSSLIYLESDLSIVCALINRYQPPMATSKPEDSEVGQKIMKLLHQKKNSAGK